MMEKRTPTYDLRTFKAVFSEPDALSMTVTAARTAAALGFDRAGIVTVIATMERKQFYKSMTSYADHRV
jgi:motility quorum-sensing regulator/GCU-specific mRNA interferase toxin